MKSKQLTSYMRFALGIAVIVAFTQCSDYFYLHFYLEL